MDQGDDGRDPYAAAAKSAERLAALTGVDRYDVAVVLGSGWAPAAAACTSALGATVTEIPVAELGGFAQPTVAGHAGTVQSLITPDLRVLMFLGRTHLYQGCRSARPCTASAPRSRPAAGWWC